MDNPPTGVAIPRRPSRGEVDRVDVVVFLGPARDTAPGPGQLDAGPHFNYVKLSHLSRLLRAAGAKRGKLDEERGKPTEKIKFWLTGPHCGPQGRWP